MCRSSKGPSHEKLNKGKEAEKKFRCMVGIVRLTHEMAQNSIFDEKFREWEEIKEIRDAEVERFVIKYKVFIAIRRSFGVCSKT